MGAAERQKILFCFVGPGASGKSTVCRRLLERDRGLCLSVSTTTRAPRGTEKDGIEYHFVDDAEFQRRVESDRFLEHAAFGGRRYGSERSNLEEAEAAGCDLLFDIDVQGAVALRARFPGRVVVVFIFPPSFAVLQERFRQRGTESEARIQERLRIADEEVTRLTTEGITDYLIINDDLETAVRDAQSIVGAERLRYTRINDELVRKMLSREG